MEAMKAQRNRSAAAAKMARDKWAEAPPHVRAVAEKYMGPMVVAMLELDGEISLISGQVVELLKGRDDGK